MSGSGVIVTGVHDEFRGMGLSGVSRFLGDGAVVVDARGGKRLRGKGFIIERYEFQRG